MNKRDFILRSVTIGRNITIPNRGIPKSTVPARQRIFSSHMRCPLSAPRYNMEGR